MQKDQERERAHGATRSEVDVTGVVCRMDTKPGAAITECHPLLMRESMKIEMMMPAPVDGRIAEIGVNVDEFVEQD